jgi:hypothetical protein
MTRDNIATVIDIREGGHVSEVRCLRRPTLQPHQLFRLAS